MASGDITTQYMAESPNIVAAKEALMKTALDTPAAQLANYQVAGMQPEQTAAMDLNLQGIGAYQPYLANAAASMTQGAGNLGEATDILRGSDTRNQFAAGQSALNNSAIAAGNMGQYANQAGAGLGHIGAGAQAINTAQGMAARSANQPGFGQAAGSLDYASQIAKTAGPSNFAASGTLLGSGLSRNEQATQQANQAANQPGFNQGIMSLQAGADQARQAANLGAAPTSTAAQTGYNPQLQNYQMGNVREVSPSGMGDIGMDAAQTTYNPSLTNYQMGPAERVENQAVKANDINAAQMGPAERVETQSFTQRGTANDYMSPYMQNVVDIQKREAGRQSAIQGQQQQAQAVSAGAFGGSRDAIQRGTYSNSNKKV